MLEQQDQFSDNKNQFLESQNNYPSGGDDDFLLENDMESMAIMNKQGFPK
jgi:hypothetical protein